MRLLDVEPSAIIQNRPLRVTSKPANGRNSGRDIDSDEPATRLHRHAAKLGFVVIDGKKITAPGAKKQGRKAEG
jgi:hypothetical protein